MWEQWLLTCARTVTAREAGILVWCQSFSQSRENHPVIQLYIVLGATGQPLCPVTAILRYIQARGPSPGVFFRKSPSEPVLKPWFVDQLRDVLAAVGLPRHQYAGHSFRIGAATTAAMAGVEDSTIQTLGRWHSSAYLQYIRLPSERLAGVSVVLAKHSNSR